jgi:hypothetical protein
MPRNRVIYQSEALYVSSGANSTTSGHHYQLDRVQSANYNFNIARQDINQFGELARIDSIAIESPTVSLDFSYYLTDGANEVALGFYVPTGALQTQSQFPSGQLVDGSGQNFYIVTTSEGFDLNAETGLVGGVANALSGKSAIGIGNAYLTDYTVDLSVGSIPTVSVSFEGSNMNAFTFSSGNNGQSAGTNLASGTKLTAPIQLAQPNSQTGSTGSTIVSALRPGDVTISFGTFTGATATGASGIGGFAELNQASASGIHIQSASLSLPLGRTPIQRLGSRYAFARTVDFPINATLSVNGVQNDLGSGSLIDLINNNPKSDITITINKPTMIGSTAIPAVRYTMKNAQLDSVGYSSSIGANKTIDLTFSTQIGGANDTANGIQMSGSYSGTTIYI